MSKSIEQSVENPLSQSEFLEANQDESLLDEEFFDYPIKPYAQSSQVEEEITVFNTTLTTETEEDEVVQTVHFDRETQVAFLFLSRGEPITKKQQALVSDVLSQDRWKMYCTPSKSITPEDALDVLTSSNEGLVRKVANRYQGRGLDWPDLVQEGLIGLLKGLRKFDEDEGVEFSTYVIPWIRQAITRAVANQGRTIRTPVYIVDRLKYFKQQLDEGRVFKDVIKLPDEANRIGVLSDKETVELENSQIKHDRKSEIINKARQRWDLLKNELLGFASLDAPIGKDSDEGETTLFDFISPIGDIAGSFQRTQFEEELREIVENCLNERERLIFYMRKKGIVYRIIGEKVGVQGSRVRQILFRNILPTLRSNKAFLMLYDEYTRVLGEMTWE